ncbi:cobalamin B12-binding domain-containing protein [Streptomyces microflavus]|uniref:cobalamin B12-binding domain-containing protein n=1 Tax=Streptomyces microflavus TaxID=1919 RepID=UPI002DD97EAB|nr:cobalamin B12-binding domain-containing protein [Streptomyces microflavus]WSA64499.1 cobalamin B12-binding domain-containing protein [Streptomyces microflavus]
MTTTTVDATGLDTLRGDLWAAVTGRDEFRAADVVLRALDAGTPAETVLLDVIAPVQSRVGRAWQADRLTVAQEHAATAIAERVVAALAHHSAHRPEPYGGRITVACVDQEWHVLPARLLAEVLTLRGWKVDFLGAQVPTPHLVAHLHSTGADAVALSSSIATRLPTAHTAITACQAVGVPVLAGGAAFGVDGRYARLLGADAWAPDARAAARRLADGIPAPDLAAGRRETDGLAHLADQEYTLVVRSRARLVGAVLAYLEKNFPAMAEYSAPQRERTAEDIAHIVEFLGVALYTDSDDLFTDFVRWTAAVLTARKVPARSLRPALDALGVELKDFPRATRMLDRACGHLDEAVPTTDQHPGASA